MRIILKLEGFSKFNQTNYPNVNVMIYTRFERNCGKFKRVHYLISFKVDMSNQSMINKIRKSIVANGVVSDNNHEMKMQCDELKDLLELLFVTKNLLTLA